MWLFRVGEVLNFYLEVCKIENTLQEFGNCFGHFLCSSGILCKSLFFDQKTIDEPHDDDKTHHHPLASRGSKSLLSSCCQFHQHYSCSQFHQHFTNSFYVCRSQVHKKDWQLDCIFGVFFYLGVVKLLIKCWWNCHL
jgi:hypothetical protein